MIGRGLFMEEFIAGSVAPPAQSPPLMLVRRRKIAEMLSAKGVVRVADLVKHFGVSDVTIRNDLEALAKEGVLVRDHGGAVAQTYTSLSVVFDQ
jgi:DeoR family transcriptional regulator, aga operon transcriptional repressor